MALVLKTADTLLERVLKPVNNSVLASVRTIKPVYKKMNLDIQADGYIDYDSRRRSSISSLYSGRIEKLYVKYNYQPIHKGQKVFEIYSPELVTDQENLVSLLTNSPDEETLIEAAKQKLKLLGFSDILLKNLLDTKKVIMAVPVFSDYEGFLYEVPSYTKPSGNMTPMGSKQKNNLQDNPQLSVKEGQYVAMGESIFDIVNVKIVAVILQINQEDISKVNTGQQVEISFDNDTTPVKGKIDFIEPLFKDGIKSLSARVYIENTNLNYKIGALVRAKIKGESFETLWIPASAVMDLGQEKKVWLKKNGYFVAKKVETGMSSNNSIEISDGLTEDSEIAVEAHYLIDSEGFIKTNEDEE
ncbi:MAG: HlyD family efflux transporter periplasmic adaptor subunit [Bacteroidia bacterium]